MNAKKAKSLRTGAPAAQLVADEQRRGAHGTAFYYELQGPKAAILRTVRSGWNAIRPPEGQPLLSNATAANLSGLAAGPGVNTPSDIALEAYRSGFVMNGHAKRYRPLWDGGYPQPPEGHTCGARTRKGTPCKLKVLYDNGRCKLHGGLSTGPKTEQGRRQSAINGRKGGRPRKNSTSHHVGEAASPMEAVTLTDAVALSEGAMPTPKTSARFDPTRSYGEIFGVGSKYRYEQDGRRFDHAGNEVDEHGNRN